MTATFPKPPKYPKHVMGIFVFFPEINFVHVTLPNKKRAPNDQI